MAPDFKKPFIVHMDVSEVGLGAVLSQTQEGEEHSVFYISSKLTKHEKNDYTLEKKCLGVKCALETLHNYLLG